MKTTIFSHKDTMLLYNISGEIVNSSDGVYRPQTKIKLISQNGYTSNIYGKPYYLDFIVPHQSNDNNLKDLPNCKFTVSIDAIYDDKQYKIVELETQLKQIQKELDILKASK